MTKIRLWQLVSSLALIALGASITSLAGVAAVTQLTSEGLPLGIMTSLLVVGFSLSAILLLPFSSVSLGEMLLWPLDKDVRDFCCEMPSDSIGETAMPFLLSGGGVSFALVALGVWGLRGRSFSLTRDAAITSGVATPLFVLGAVSIIDRLGRLANETCPTLFCGG